MPIEGTHIDTKAATAADRPKFDATDKLRLQKAVKDFEAVLVAYMLKNMRNSIQKSDLMDDGLGGDMWEGMFDSELSKHITNQSQFGLAESLYRRLTGEPLPTQLRTIPELERVIPEAPKARVIVQPQVTAQPAPAPIPVSTPPAQTALPASVKPERLDAVTDATAVAKPKSRIAERLATYETIIDTAAQAHGVDPVLIKAVIATESAGKANARSSKEAKGLMQLIDSTAADMGVKNVWDPEENINGGTKYLKKMLERFDGDLKLALASYNAGPGAVERHKGIPPYRETRDYVSRVMHYMKQYEQEIATHGE